MENLYACIMSNRYQQHEFLKRKTNNHFNGGHILNE